ncbi:hypothetical protein ACSBR1_016370 [Camellia fascicularis]
MCVSLINEEINLMDQVEHEKLTQIHNKKTIMKRAGSSIEEYHQLQLQQPDMDISASSCGYKLILDYLFDNTCALSSVVKSNNKIQVPKSIPGSQYSTVLDVQVKKRMKGIEHNYAQMFVKGEVCVYRNVDQEGNKNCLHLLGTGFCGAWRTYKSVESGRLCAQMRRLLQLYVFQSGRLPAQM